MPAPAVVITPELLHQAWQQRRRADWPARYEDVMANDMLRRLVRAEAVGMALAARNRARTQARRAAETPSPWPPSLTEQVRGPGVPPERVPRTAITSPAPLRSQRFDPKRAACGDLDESD